MVQKRILMTLAIPVAAAVARFAANKLRAQGKTSIASNIDKVVDFVSPPAKKKGGMFGR